MKITIETIKVMDSCASMWSLAPMKKKVITSIEGMPEITHDNWVILKDLLDQITQLLNDIES